MIGITIECPGPASPTSKGSYSTRSTCQMDEELDNSLELFRPEMPSTKNTVAHTSTVWPMEKSDAKCTMPSMSSHQRASRRNENLIMLKQMSASVPNLSLALMSEDIHRGEATQGEKASQDGNSPQHPKRPSLTLAENLFCDSFVPVTPGKSATSMVDTIPRMPRTPSRTHLVDTAADDSHEIALPGFPLTLHARSNSRRSLMGASNHSAGKSPRMPTTSPQQNISRRSLADNTVISVDKSPRIPMSAYKSDSRRSLMRSESRLSLGIKSDSRRSLVRTESRRSLSLGVKSDSRRSLARTESKLSLGIQSDSRRSLVRTESRRSLSVGVKSDSRRSLVRTESKLSLGIKGEIPPSLIRSESRPSLGRSESRLSLGVKSHSRRSLGLKSDSRRSLGDAEGSKGFDKSPRLPNSPYSRGEPRMPRRAFTSEFRMSLPMIKTESSDFDRRSDHSEPRNTVSSMNLSKSKSARGLGSISDLCSIADVNENFDMDRSRYSTPRESISSRDFCKSKSVRGLGSSDHSGLTSATESMDMDRSGRSAPRNAPSSTRDFRKSKSARGLGSASDHSRMTSSSGMTTGNRPSKSSKAAKKKKIKVRANNLTEAQHKMVSEAVKIQSEKNGASSDSLGMSVKRWKADASVGNGKRDGLARWKAGGGGSRRNCLSPQPSEKRLQIDFNDEPEDDDQHRRSKSCGQRRACSRTLQFEDSSAASQSKTLSPMPRRRINDRNDGALMKTCKLASQEQVPRKEKAAYNRSMSAPRLYQRPRGKKGPDAPESPRARSKIKQVVQQSPRSPQGKTKPASLDHCRREPRSAVGPHKEIALHQPAIEQAPPTPSKKAGRRLSDFSPLKAMGQKVSSPIRGMRNLFQINIHGSPKKCDQTAALASEATVRSNSRFQCLSRVAVKPPLEVEAVNPPAEIAVSPPDRGVARNVSEISDDELFRRIREAGVSEAVLQSLTNAGLVISERDVRF